MRLLIGGILILMATIIGLLGFLLGSSRKPLTVKEAFFPPAASSTAESREPARSTSTFAPNTFRGPSGPPHIIGPKSNPPNY